MAQTSENPWVRVKLKSGLSAITLEGLGKSGNQKLLIQRVKQNNEWLWQLGQSPLRKDRILRFDGHNLHHGEMLFPNTIILVGRNHSFEIVGVLPLEDYLVGVLASEMPLSWPIETLKAQAVAARSYSLARIKERAKDFFDLESTVADQVFEHIRLGPDNNPMIEKAKIAVKETQGLVLLSPLTNQVIKAYYHSSCGGRTQDSKAVWGIGPNTGVAVDSFCEQNPKAHWTLKVNLKTLSEKLKGFFKSPALPELSELQASKGMLNIETLWANKEKKSIAAQDMRAILGYDQLRSTAFSMKKQGDAYIFEGRGFGHGVGLCQWGAKAMGKAGSQFDEIIRHYYPKADMKSLGQVLRMAQKQKNLLQQAAEEGSSQIKTK